MCTRGSSRSATRRSSTRRRREEACTAAVLLDVDPVGMVRGRGGKGGAEDQYVNDRPYVASSLLSVVLSRWFNSALGGRCERKPDLAASELPLEARLAAVPCRGGEAFLRALFEPLGYTVEATRHELDESMPALGPSRLFTVTLRATRRLSDLLTHLYVLVPVLDDQKHYWVGDDEVEKLLRHGEGWLDQPSVARRHRLALSRASARARSRRHRPADGGGTARRRGRGRPEGRAGSVDRADDQPQRTPARRRVRGAEGFRRFARPRSRLRRGQAPAPPPGRSPVRGDRRHGRVRTSTRSGGIAPQARSAGAEAARAHSPDARFADVSRQSAQRIRRGVGGRSHRTSRPASAACIRARALRVGASGNHRSDDAERRIQREMAVAACGTVPTPGSPLRVDAPRVPELGE